MPRTDRVDIGDEIYHVLNRANGRLGIFATDPDYRLFEALLKEAKELTDMRILAYTIMPNHWHLVLYPRKDGDLAVFMHWLTLTHTRRYHSIHKTVGHGHLYQGRYKSFLVDKDDYLRTLIRYVERNPLRARMVDRAEDWQWGSAWRRLKGSPKEKKLIAQPQTELPRRYASWLNDDEDDDTLTQLRNSVNKGTPYGTMEWTEDIIEQYDLQSTVRGTGRPKKHIRPQNYVK